MVCAAFGRFGRFCGDFSADHAGYGHSGPGRMDLSVVWPVLLVLLVIWFMKGPRR